MPRRSGDFGQGDRERVLTEDLAAVLRQWRQQYEAERPPTDPARVMLGYKPEFVTANQYFVLRTGVDDGVLRRILNSNTQTTNLWLADRILSGLCLSYKLSDGSIRAAELPTRSDRKHPPGPPTHSDRPTPHFRGKASLDESASSLLRNGAVRTGDALNPNEEAA